MECDQGRQIPSFGLRELMSPRPVTELDILVYLPKNNLIDSDKQWKWLEILRHVTTKKIYTIMNNTDDET